MAGIRLEWAQFGDFDSFDVIRSDTSMENIVDANLPNPIATNLKTMYYVDTSVIAGLTYYYKVRVWRDNNNFVSSEVVSSAMASWTPDNLTSQIYLDADDLTEAQVASWVDRKTGISFSQANASLRPILSELNGNKAIYLDGSNDILSSNNIALTSILNNKSYAWLFVVMKKDGSDSSGVSRRIFIFEAGTGAGLARFGFYADDATAGNVNKLVLGTRRLDSDSYNYLATSQIISNQAIIAFGSIDYSMKNMKSILNGGVSENKTATFSSGVTSATNSNQLTIGGGASSFKGWIASIVAGNAELSLENRQKLEGWAAHKYGLTSNLPLDHPYKTTPPYV